MFAWLKGVMAVILLLIPCTARKKKPGGLREEWYAAIYSLYQSA